MTSSVNQPWAISEKFINRYGEIWANIDFELDQLYEREFKNEPLDTKVGIFKCNNIIIPFKYRHLLSESIRIRNLINELYLENIPKQELIQVTVMNRVFQLKRHEIAKIAETLENACEIVLKSYQLGLYL